MSHDPHITNSLYALLIMAMFDGLDQLGQEKLDKLADYMASLQNPDGSFSGDMGGEVDTRFSYCAVSALSLLNKLDKIDRNIAQHIIKTLSNNTSITAQILKCKQIQTRKTTRTI